MGTGRSNPISFKVATQRDLVATSTFPYTCISILNPIDILDGEIRFDTVDVSLATECYIGYVDNFGFFAGDIFSRMTSDDLITFYVDERRFVEFNIISAVVTPPVGSSGYITFTIDKLNILGIMVNNLKGSVNVALAGNVASFVELFDDSLAGIDINMPVIGDRYPVAGLTVKDNSDALTPNVGLGNVTVAAGGSGKYSFIFTFTVMLNKAAQISGEFQINGVAQTHIEFTDGLIASQSAVIAVSGDFRVEKTDAFRFVLFSDKANVITNIKKANFKVMRIKG